MRQAAPKLESVGDATGDATGDREPGSVGAAEPPVPGLVLIFSGDSPQCFAIRAPHSEIELGRESLLPATQVDQKISRRHVRVRREAERWLVMDQGSRNGTTVDGVDGVDVPPSVYKEVTRCLRMGDSLFVVTPNVLRYETLGVQSYEGRVVGPTLAARFQAIARLSRTSSTLHISGESGVGKELAARAFHASGASPSGPFVAVNCAAIPEGVAERLLFGARRGAFSGAIADSEGYIQAADGGTLFLDEVAELDPLVQGKLLRVLETKEVLALGASRPRTVDVRICSATCRDLRNEVAKGRLREDLYYRLGRPEVVIPPLYDRPEEIPWLIGSELARSGAGVVPHASVVEACLLRRWPGNIRELLTELRVAIEETQAAGSGRLEGKHLSPTAGVVLSPQRAMVPPAAPSDGRSSLTKAALREILRREKGNVSSAARALGVHRNQMRRWLVRHQIDPIEFTAPASRRRQRQDR